MAREIPEAVRAAAGLAATVLDEARRLPETLPGLPVRVLGLAMQLSMKLQQHYAGLVARGDELLTGLRGEDEPGLATFDDDEPIAPGGPAPSAFDRVAETVIEVVEDDETRDAVTDDVEPAETVLDDLAIEELVDEAPAATEVADASGQDAVLPAEADVLTDAEALTGAGALTDADGLDDAAVLAAGEADGGAVSGAATDGVTDGATDIATEVDVLTPEGTVETVEANVTDEGVAAPEAPEAEDDAAAGAASGDGPAVDTATDESGTQVAAATGVSTAVDEGTDDAETSDAVAEGAAVDAVGGESAAPTDEPEGGSELSGSQAAGTAPIEGYDSWSIAQLRGRLRGYQLVTVQDLLTYEEATRAREPYLRMLRNRLEKLEEQAVESSPLAPRGT